MEHQNIVHGLVLATRNVMENSIESSTTRTSKVSSHGEFSSLVRLNMLGVYAWDGFSFNDINCDVNFRFGCEAVLPANDQECTESIPRRSTQLCYELSCEDPLLKLLWSQFPAVRTKPSIFRSANISTGLRRSSIAKIVTWTLQRSTRSRKPLSSTVRSSIQFGLELEITREMETSQELLTWKISKISFLGDQRSRWKRVLCTCSWRRQVQRLVL